MASELRIEASTTATSENCTFKWTIKNYRVIKLQVGEVIVSPNFGVGSDNKQYFNLHLYPGGVTTENTAYISLYLKALIDSTKKPDKLVCRWSVSVINDKKDIHKLTMHHDFATTNFKGRGWPQFFELANIDQLISSENTVTIQCELEVFKEFKSSLDCPNIIDGENRIIDQVNLSDMFLHEEFSDVKIKISDTHDIPAHKAILAPASPLFMAMFRRDENSENKKSSVKITKPNENTVIEMLQFIYTGEVDVIETDQIIKLLEVAHEYQVDNLKTKCGKILCGHLSSENAIDILVNAHKYKLKNLEDEAIKFITNHTELLLNSEKIKKIGNLDIMINLMQSIVKSQKNVW